jgi:hypothetical protein
VVSFHGSAGLNTPGQNYSAVASATLA